MMVERLPVKLWQTGGLVKRRLMTLEMQERKRWQGSYMGRSA